MKPTLILERIAADGLTLSISEDGFLDIDGDQTKIDSWLETIRENKSTILFELRDKRVLKMLEADPERKYALFVHDAGTDPVLVTVGIRGLAVFDLSIPQAHYDGMTLIEVLEQHCDSKMGEKAA
ncbi:MAG TPA: hypothetical protein VHB01_13495 [Nitrosospira sp.]|nr:hypothetical protein [Nitrosospira sp.]